MVCKLYGEQLNAKAPAIATVSEASAKLTAILAAMEEAHKKAVPMKVLSQERKAVDDEGAERAYSPTKLVSVFFVILFF